MAIETREFLDAILPAKHNLCLGNVAQPKPQANGRKPPFRHIFIQRDNTIRLTKQLALVENDETRHWYIAVATYGPSKDGRKRKNAKLIRCLVIDIDIKDDDPKHFASKAEVLQALKNLHTQVPQLPRPWLVDSGHGIHVYYSVGEDMSPATWSPLSVLFANVVAKVEPRLISDRKRTVDLASVLRLPGTKNIKREPFLDVKILNKRPGGVGVLSDIRSGLASAAATLGADGSMSVLPQGFLADTKPAYMQGIPDEHTFGKGMDAIKDWQLEDLNPRRILTECNQMRWMAAEQKGDVPEPQWLLMLRVFNTCKKGDDLAVHFSAGHAMFSEAETRQKMRHVRKNFDSPSASCEEFNDERPGKCRGCAFRGSIWTPSQIAHIEERKEAIDDAEQRALEDAEDGAKDSGGFIPQPDHIYQRPASRGQQLVTIAPVLRGAGKHKRTEDEVIMHGHLHLKYSTEKRELRMTNGRNTMQGIDRRIHMQADLGQYEVNVSISTEEISHPSAATSTRILRTVGVPMDIRDKAKADAIGDYLATMQRLAMTVTKPVYPDKGWIKEGPLGTWSFISGLRRYYPDGTVEECVSTAEHLGRSSDAHGYMEDAMTGVPVGQKQFWQQGMKMYGGRQYPAQLLLLSGLANLILPLLTDKRGGILLSLTGASGRGKTTLLRFMVSLMGFHDDYILGGNSTEAAFGSIMRQANCMLIAADDSLTQDAQALSALLSLVTGGTDKSRMRWDSKDGQSLDKAKAFQASLLLTSNYSTSDIIGRGNRYDNQLQTEAARTRTLEVNVDQIINETYTIKEWDHAEALISNHYGHAAHEFLQYVVQHQRTLRTALRKQREWVLDQINDDIPDSKRGTVRFWAQFLALINVTAYIVCHKLSLLPWNHLKIRDAGIELVRQTLIMNTMTDEHIVGAVRHLLTHEPEDALHDPVNRINHTITNETSWTDARTMDGRGRSAYSKWEETGFTGGAGKKWRLDTYRHKEINNTQRLEQVVSIPHNALRGIIHTEGQMLGVTGLADLQRALQDAGCIVNGMKDGGIDTETRTARRIHQTSSHKPSNPIQCVEIIFPPVIISAED